MIHPKVVTPLKIGDRIVSERVRVAVLGLFAAWMIVFAAATFLVTIQKEMDLVSSATAITPTLNVVGPGLGMVGASENFEAVNAFGRVVLTGCMLLERLEIFTALQLFAEKLIFGNATQFLYPCR